MPCGAARVSCFLPQHWPVYKSVCETYLIIVLDSHDKGKDAVAVFVDFLFDHFDDPGAVHTIWSDGPS